MVVVDEIIRKNILNFSKHRFFITIGERNQYPKNV